MQLNIVSTLRHAAQFHLVAILRSKLILY